MRIVYSFASAAFVVALLLVLGPALFAVAVGLSIAFYALLLKAVFGTVYNYVRDALARRFAK